MRDIFATLYGRKTWRLNAARAFGVSRQAVEYWAYGMEAFPRRRWHQLLDRVNRGPYAIDRWAEAEHARIDAEAARWRTEWAALATRLRAEHPASEGSIHHPTKGFGYGKR